MKSKFTSFLLVVALCSGVAQAEQTVWRISSGIDDLTDEYSIHAHGINAEQAGGVVVSCFGRLRMQASIIFGEFLGNGGKPIPVKYRVNKESVREIVGWTVHTQDSGTAVSVDKLAEVFSRDLLWGLFLTAEAVTYDKKRHRVRISLEKADKHIDKVLETCSSPAKIKRKGKG